MPPIDLDRFELDSDDNNDIDMWCDNFWDLWLPRQRLEPIITRIGRSLDEILELEVEIIEENTELEPKLWIKLYAAKFRAIITDDSTLTKFQVKCLLYTR